MAVWGEAAAREIALLHWAETQPVGDLWTREDARWATALARAEKARQRGADLQRERSRHAAQRLRERDERLGLLLALPTPAGRWAGRAALLGAVAGVTLERLGGAQMNLLALPLWGVLALQLLGYLAFVLTRGRMGWAQRLWARAMAQRSGAGAGHAASALAHWLRLSAPLQQARAALLWHALLLGLSAGLVLGLYARALQKEYVIGWESTYLEAAQVQRLADTVLAPASRLSGVAVPAVAPLRHGAAQAPRTPAGPWLHLLALTVGLVALPRLALALLAALRCARYALALPLPAGPGDVRLAVIDPERRLAGSLLGGQGEVWASPEGDRLMLTPLTQAPPPPSPWRWLAGRTAEPPADAVLDAATLPTGTPGWPAQRRQLRALQLPARRQAAWARLLLAWEAEQTEREARALQAMSQTLGHLAAQRLQLHGPEATEQALAEAVQRHLQPPLDELAATLHTLYGSAAPDVRPDDSLPSLPGTLRRPLPQARSAQVGGVVGGVMGGALTGLKADLASGGLTLGAGALAGALLGGLGAAGLTNWLNRAGDRHTASLQLDAQALPALAQAVLTRWQAAVPLALPADALAQAVAQQAWTLPPDAGLRAVMAQLLAASDEAAA